MNLCDAAELRMSVRTFCQEELNNELLDELDIFIAGIEGYNPGIDVNVEIVKTLGKKMRPPYYAVLYSEDKPGNYMNAGFIMEQIVLYLISRGVATCYKMLPIGINSRDELGRKYMICIAFGIPKDEMYRNPDSAKRIAIDRLCVMKSKATRDMRSILKIARLAPSSFNSQPWRFVVSEGKIHVFKREAGTSLTDHISDIDVGIMLANIVTCAEELWIDITVKEVSDIKTKKYANNKYIVTIKFD